MFAYDYPLLGAFWTMLFFFFWVIWIVLLVRTVFDVFRSDDLGGVAKALWILFLVVLPYLGVFVYVVARGRGMRERDVQRALASEAAFRDYVRSAAGGSGGVASELASLADLHDRGKITDAEFEAQKARLFA